MMIWPDHKDFYAGAAAQIIGGAAVQFRRSAKMGAGVLGGVLSCLCFAVYAWNRRQPADL
jgi:hypothetical protein